MAPKCLVWIITNVAGLKDWELPSWNCTCQNTGRVTKKKIHLEDQQHPQGLAFRLVPLEHIREERRKKMNGARLGMESGRKRKAKNDWSNGVASHPQDSHATDCGNWCFWTMVLKKTLESPMDCKEIQPVHPKGDQSWIFIGRTDAEAETPNTLATWFEEPIPWKRPWCWEKLKAGGEGDNRGWDGWMASLTWWTWVWVSSRSWWWTGKPGMLQSSSVQSSRSVMSDSLQPHCCSVVSDSLQPHEPAVHGVANSQTQVSN